MVSHVGGRDPSTWAIFYCFPRCISRRLDGKRSSQHVDASMACSENLLLCNTASWQRNLTEQAVPLQPPLSPTSLPETRLQ